MSRRKITVAGLGYVGASMAALLSRKHDVTVIDINESRVNAINERVSPIADADITELFKGSKISLVATTDKERAYKDADYVIVAVPTNYDESTGRFDTHCIEEVVEAVLGVNPTAVIVVKSTIPVGYTESLRRKYGVCNILFSPEFLREGHALYDNLHPSRVIVGYPKGNNVMELKALEFVSILVNASEDKNVRHFVMGTTEAEAVKLFANSYLAMRVSFFNELDTFAEDKKLDARDIINGVCTDRRIREGYNNPSFGYGGYCLPKDTKQLARDFASASEGEMFDAVVKSNSTRKKHIVDSILNMTKAGDTIGVYRLAMKAGSDNFRESAILDVAKAIPLYDRCVVVYEPSISDNVVPGYDMAVENDLEAFKRKCNLIICNRKDSGLDHCAVPIYTRDVFGIDA